MLDYILTYLKSPDYLISLVIFIAIYALFSLGLNLQWGVTGLLNFGHAGFLAVGAYTTVLLNLRGLPWPLAMVAGGLMAALLGLLMGFSTLRLREDYLAIVTIGISEVVRLVALNEEWLTNGTLGLQGFPLPLENFKPNLVTRYAMIAWFTVIMGAALWQGLKGVRRLWGETKARWRGPIGLFTLLATAIVLWLYGICVQALYSFRDQPARNGLLLIAVTMLALVYVALEQLVQSPWGRVLKAIREDEEIAKALGKNVFAYKLQALMLGGFIAGLAAAFDAWQITNVYPNNFRTDITFTTWTIVVLGGAGRNAGTILGAAIFWIYNAFTRDLDKIAPFLTSDQVGALRVMIIGLILMALMMFRPQGILGKKAEMTLGR
jgi:neutral amino acid transport system permease protein